MKAVSLVLILLSFSAVGETPCYSALRFISVNEAPANYVDENGEFDGFTTGIVKQLQSQLDIDIPLEVMPEARAMMTLNSNANVVMFSISRTRQRESNYHWLGHVISKRWVLYSRYDSQDDVTSLQQVIDTKVIGVIRGDIREKWLNDKRASYVISIPSYENAIEMLMRGRIDYLFYESFGVYSTLKNLGYTSDMVKSQLVVTESDVYIAMSKSLGSDDMALALQQELELLMASDWYKAHIEKWVNKLNAEKVADAWFAKGVLQY